MNLTELLRNSGSLIPELVLSLTICLLCIGDMFVPLQRSRAMGRNIAVLGLLAAIAALLTYSQPGTSFFGTFVVDPLATLFKLIALTGSLIVVLFSARSMETAGYRWGEFLSLLLGVALGACFLASANNFILFAVAFETVSLCSYVLAGYVKHERAPAEAALKYMLYGALSSGIMLFGISYVFGLTGTLSITEGMSGLVAPETSPIAAFLAFTLLAAGIGFKISMVPFHFWCPDVYQGAPTPVTAFLSVVSKAAGFSAVLRIALPLVSDAFPPLGVPQAVIGVLAMITMTYGNFVALRQTDVKRLMAYSSIAHAGYLLLGIAAFQSGAFEALAAYLVAYLFMNLGAFWIIILLIRETRSAQLDAFRGIAYKAPFLFVLLFVCLIGLTGLPPTAGFVVKFLLFKAVVDAGFANTNLGSQIFFLVLALVGVMNSAVSLYYYMKLAKAMVFDAPEDSRPLNFRTLDYVYAGAVTLPVLIFLNFGLLLKLVEGVGLPLRIALLP